MDPRTRRIGFAFFADDELRDWGIKNVKTAAPIEQRRQLTIPMLIRLLDQFRPLVLLVPASQSGAVPRSQNARDAVRATTEEARRRSIVVHSLSNEDIRRAFEGLDATGNPSRDRINLAVVRRFPELTVSIPRVRRDYDKQPYSGPLFFAASLYLTWRRQHRDQ